MIYNPTPPYRLYHMPCTASTEPERFKDLGEVYDHIKDALDLENYVVQSDYEGDEQIDCATLVTCCKQLYIPKSIRQCISLMSTKS